eukprot:4190789-Prymnesium_polylepis.1
MRPHGVSSKREHPADGPLPPSLVRKRPKGKLIQLAAFDMTIRPDADGRWPCKGCDTVLDTRAQLVGH